MISFFNGCRHDDVAHQAAEDRREWRLRPVRSRALRGGGARPPRAAPAEQRGAARRRYAAAHVRARDVHRAVRAVPRRRLQPPPLRRLRGARHPPDDRAPGAYGVARRRPRVHLCLQGARAPRPRELPRHPRPARTVAGDRRVVVGVVVVAGVVAVVVEATRRRAPGAGGGAALVGRRCACGGRATTAGTRGRSTATSRLAHVEAARRRGTPRGQVRRRRPSEARPPRATPLTGSLRRRGGGQRRRRRWRTRR